MNMQGEGGGWSSEDGGTGPGFSSLYYFLYFRIKHDAVLPKKEQKGMVHANTSQAQLARDTDNFIRV